MFILMKRRDYGGKVAAGDARNRCGRKSSGRALVNAAACGAGARTPPTEARLGRPGARPPLGALRHLDLARRGRQEAAEQADRRQEGADLIDEGEARLVGQHAEQGRADAAKTEAKSEEQ